MLGPEYRWPLVLLPPDAIMARIPATREGVKRLGLVTLDRMVGALISSVEHPPAGVRIVDLPAIRRAELD